MWTNFTTPEKKRLHRHAGVSRPHGDNTQNANAWLGCQAVVKSKVHVVRVQSGRSFFCDGQEGPVAL
jgi:hypothetical protein